MISDLIFCCLLFFFSRNHFSIWNHIFSLRNRIGYDWIRNHWKGTDSVRRVISHILFVFFFQIIWNDGANSSSRCGRSTHKPRVLQMEYFSKKIIAKSLWLSWYNEPWHFDEVSLPSNHFVNFEIFAFHPSQKRCKVKMFGLKWHGDSSDEMCSFEFWNRIAELGEKFQHFASGKSYFTFLHLPQIGSSTECLKWSHRKEQ